MRVWQSIVLSLVSVLPLGLSGALAAEAASQLEPSGVAHLKKQDDKDSKKSEKKKPKKKDNHGPAGERWRTYNITMNPLGALFGIYSGTFNYGLADNITVGLAGGYQSYSLNTSVTSGSTTTSTTTTMNAFNFGLRANYYLVQRYSQNFYLGLEAGFAPFSLNIATAKGSLSAVTLGVLVGYAFMTDFGLNFMLGAGVRYSTTPSTAILNDGKSYPVPAFLGVVPNLELNIGYAF